MFYEPHKRNHGLRYDPFKALIVPRPIGWISSLRADGAVNLAPYSFFNGISARPPMVMFASEGEKDSLRNVRDTREFVCNFVSRDLAVAMNDTSAPLPHGTSEFGYAGLTAVPSHIVSPPRVAEAKAALECKLLQVVAVDDLEGQPTDRFLVIGQVVGVHIDDAMITDGMVIATRMRALARLGYNDYASVDEAFEITRPKGGANELAV